MAADFSETRTARRRPAAREVCPVLVKCLKMEGQASVLRQDRKSATVSKPRTGSSLGVRTHLSGSQEPGRGAREEAGATERDESSEDELGRLDIDLDRKSRQHNLTSSNVRAILHEVITHEHVVAMMKTAIRETQDLPMFEPKMTRSRLKQVVQEGQPLNWSLSVVNTVKPPQFVDIDLDEEEDDDDEEYCPDDEEEDEDTAEEIFLSDGDSLSSPLKIFQSRQPEDQRTNELLQSSPGHLRQHMMTSACQQLLSAPAESFMERLNAVEEELDSGSTLPFNQSLHRKAEDDEDDGDDEGCLAFRTRSKVRLVNIPLGQLEAELLAPDITADMYDLSAALQEEDRHWTKWLQGLMVPDNEEEADDDDDPEYNFRDDMDEPDLEDYRTDRAVQITKREVNELLDELFETLQEEEVGDEGQEPAEDEEALSQTAPKFNVPQALRFEAPLADLLTERRQMFKKQYEALQQRRALQDTTNHHQDHINRKDTPPPQLNFTSPVLVLPSLVSPAFHLDSAQKLKLQAQIQQHVQLLTEVQLLSRHVDALKQEACITKRYLDELEQFARRQEELFLPSSFRVCNLQGALALLQEVEQRAAHPPAAADPSASRRWLPRMTPATNSHAFPLLPAHAAWLFATRPVFLYPELLPVCCLDPALHNNHQRSIYTAGEDGLIVLGLKHFEGAVDSEQLISSYLLCKNRWSLRKHIKEMTAPRGPAENVIKLLMTHHVVPPLPRLCSRVQPGDQRPPVDRNTSNMPSWLKNSQQIIQKTRLGSNSYPPSLPPTCTLRLHPHYLSKTSRPHPPRHRRLFNLAHNAFLLPLAKAPADRQVEAQAERQVAVQPISYLSVSPPRITILSDSPVSGAHLLAPPPVLRAIPLAAVHPVPSHPACAEPSCLPIGQSTQQSTAPLALPLPSLSTTNPIIPSSAAPMTPSCLLLQMVLMEPAPPTTSSQPASGQQHHRPIREGLAEVKQTSTGPRPPGEEKSQVEEEDLIMVGVVSLSGGEKIGGEEEEGRGGGGGGGGEETGSGGREEQRQEGEEGQREDGGAERDEEEGEKEKDEDQDQQGDDEEEEEEEDEEEEDFDDLTQDEDEEEVMSSASEESVLSVPELQETMKQLTWLAAERRLCADGDSEEDHSPTSAGSQEEEEEEEEEEEGPKGEESEEGRSGTLGGDEEMPSGEGTPRGGGRCPGRGRGRTRPLGSLRSRRQERRSKDSGKLLLLFDENILDNDPQRESKDVAFAQSYLNRVREELQDVPAQVEEFVSLLNKFEQVGDGQEVVLLFRRLRCILGDRTDLLRDFAAFLQPEQALQCGLWEEQQAFDRSKRFLRQLEISFGENPSHYQKIIKALQTSPELSPGGVHELKAQMVTLLKGHTHLQAEFWVFFDDLRPPPACPGQFEEAHWPEEGVCGLDSGDAVVPVSGGGASGGFEEVTLPELEEEEEGHKIQPATSRRQKRKMDAHKNYKDCDWLDKDWPCHDTKIRRHTRKGCSRCHDNKTSGGVSRAMKSLDPLYSDITSVHNQSGDKYLEQSVEDSPPQDRSSASWEGSFRLTDEKEEEELEDEEDNEDEKKNKEQSPAATRSRREEALRPFITSSSSLSPSVTSSTITSSVSSSIFTSTSVTSSSPSVCTSSSSSITSSSITSSSATSPSSAPPDLPVCAKNISLTASGEKVILWTREADRVILTTCQQEGANQNTFQSISTLLGNKTPSEVSRRFQDLMHLFRTAARQTSSEDEAPPNEPAANEEEG